MKKRAWIVSLLTCIALLTACTDDGIDTYTPEVPDAALNSRLAKTNCMEQNAKGEWVTSQRVPLVGDGRMVNTLTDAFISLINDAGGDHIDNIVDTDLTNAASIKNATVGADLIMNTLTSVLDIYHTYAAGQSAGFVIRTSNPGLLDVKALNGFWIALYHKGEQVQLKGANSGDGGALLGLHLLAPSNRDGQMAVAVKAEKPFDEIRLGVYGVQANVLEALQVMYAYVGDNPMIPLEKGHAPAPFNPSIYDPGIGGTWTYNMVNEQRLVNGEKLNDAAMKAPSVLVDIGGAVTVNAGGAFLKPGMEVGYQMGGFDPLKVSLGNTELSVYAQNDKHKVATLREGGLLGLALLGDERSTCSLVIPDDAQEDGQYIYMRFPGGLALFDVVQLYHAFVRKPVEIDLTSYFSVGNDTIENNFYQFPTPDPAVGTVKYDLIDYPTGATPNWSKITPNRLHGMKVKGDYKLLVTFTHVDGRKYTQEITIHRNLIPPVGAACDQLFYTGDEYGSRLGAGGAGGCVICIGGNHIKNQEALLDANKSTYTSVINPVQIIGSDVLAHVEFTKQAFKPSEETRIGFAMQTRHEFLNLDVVKLFSITCKDENGDSVAYGGGVAEGNNGISVGLLGGSGGKVRFSIKVPAGKAIHSVELRKSDVLSASLSSLNIYYMFHEPVSGNCSSASSRLGVGDACMEMMTPASYGTKIDYDEMGGSFLGLAGGVKNLYRFIDSNKESNTSMNNIVGIGQNPKVSVKFNEMPPFQTVGILVGGDNHLLDVDLLTSGIAVSAWHKGKKIRRQVADGKFGGVLGLQLMGYGGDTFIEITPGFAFDELRVEFPHALVSGSKSFKLFGLFTRRDNNGNGTPDCSEEEDIQSLGLNFKSIDTHVCVNRNGGTAAVKAVITGGKGNEKVTLTFQNYADRTIEKQVETTLQGVEAVVQLPCGDWFLVKGTYLDEQGAPQDIQGIDVNLSRRVMVHPRQTTWTAKNANDATDWLRWDNWSEGIPWSCTDVLIPGGMTAYPVLKAEAAAEKGFWTQDCNRCNFIQFAPGAEVKNTHYLSYEQAWVDVTLAAGEYNMFAAPLKEMYTGDMFASDAVPQYDYTNSWTTFEKANEINRFAPKVYQRVWNRSVQNAAADDGGFVAVNPDENHWTAPFNLVAQPYHAGQGVLVRPGTEGEGNVRSTFRFPKRHTRYKYYDLLTAKELSREEAVVRNSVDVGRFICEDAAGNVKFPYHVTLENERPGDMYLAGNPFMWSLSAKAFFEANPAVGEIRFLTKNGAGYGYTTWTRTSATADQWIKPAQAFLVKVAPAYRDMYRYKLTIHFVGE